MGTRPRPRSPFAFFDQDRAHHDHLRRPRRAARGRRRRRPRLRLGPPGEVQAARRPGRRQRRPRRRRDPRGRRRHHHPARLPPRPAPQGHQRQAGPGRQPQRRRRRRPGPPGPERHRGEDARPARCSPTWSARARRSSRPRAAGAASATRRWPHARRKAPGFALLGEPGDEPRPRARAQDGRRRRPRRLPERRQVQPDRGAVRRPAEDRRLPVHDAGAEPRRRAGRRGPLHRRRRARPDPRRQPRARASAWSSCGTSSGAASWCTSSTAPPSSRAATRSSDLDVIEAELAAYGGLRRTGPGIVALNKIDVPDGRELAELVRPTCEARGLTVFEVSAATHEGLRELSFAMADVVAEARSAAPDLEAARHRAAADGRRRRRLHRRQAGRPVRRRPARSPSAGCGRPTSATTRPSATWPTGWPGSASRRPWSRPAPSPATRSSSATGERGVVFDWEPTLQAGAELLHGRRGHDLRLEGAPDRAERTDARRRPGRGQGRVVVADHRGAADRRRQVDALVDALAAAHAAGARGRPGVLRRDRLRAGAARPRPPAARPGHPAGGRQRRPGPAGRPLHRRPSPGTASPSARCCSPPTT